jgi:D-alanyl-D-alanine carboxypeptidase (penicillin-binding protein 5/6)
VTGDSAITLRCGDLRRPPDTAHTKGVPTIRASSAPIGRSQAWRRLSALVGSLVLLSLITAPAAAAAPSASPTKTSPTAAPSPAASQYPTPAVLPPVAPTPTSNAKSPAVPDRNPPQGGIGPDGHVVGGDQLLSRDLVLPAGAPELPSGIGAAAWVLADLDSGTVLAARDAHGRYQPASILKLLTSVVVLPKLPGATVISPTSTDATVEGSHVGLVANGRYTADDLFTGLMLESGNDAASALATAAGGVDKTVAAMNAEATALGAYDTFAETPSGLDGWSQLTSAYDMTLVLRAALNEPRLIAYDQKDSAELPAQDVGGEHHAAVPLTNQSNPFFASVPGALLAKSGYTDAARQTYVAAASRNGRRLGIVFLRNERFPVDQYKQAASLFDWGYALPVGTPAVGNLVAPAKAKSTAAPVIGQSSAKGTLAQGPGSAKSPPLMPILIVTLCFSIAGIAAGRIQQNMEVTGRSTAR